MMHAPKLPSARTRAFVDWTLRRGRWIWLVVLLVAIPATFRTAQLYLHLKSDLEELLPRDAASVHAADELRERLPGLQYLGVVVDVGDASHMQEGERFIDALAARIRAYPPDLVRGVRTGTGEERAFLESHAALYLDLQDLQSIRQRLEARRDWEVARETGASLDEGGPPPSLSFDDINKKYDEKLPAQGERDGERFSSTKQHLTMLLVEVGGFDSGTSHSKLLLNRVKADVAAVRAETGYAKNMRVGYSGDVPIAVEELEALVDDLALSTVLVVVAVIAVLVFYYRWSRSVLVIIPPLLLAAVYAFAIASLPPFNVTSLNSNTAFLGSIIIGNGINFGIVLLARYVEERRRGQDVHEALVIAVGSARLGTLSAALGAGIAYASLVSTEFRGFRQFGIIGGLGMALSWIFAFVCMPPLIAWFDRAGHAEIARRKENHFVGRVGRFTERFPALILAVGAVLTVLSAVKVSTFDMNEIDSDFSKLRRRDTWTKGEGYWGARMDSMLGQYLTPTIVLADRPDQANAIAARLKDESKRPPLEQMVSNVRTLDDVLPAHQEEKLAEAAVIRADVTPTMRSLIDLDKRALVDRILGEEDAKPITLADLPRTFTIGMVERDGSAGRTVLVYPRPSKALWAGPPLSAFVRALRDAAAGADGARPARVAGALPLSADIVSRVQHDGVIASAVAFFGVVGVVLLMLRRSSATLYVIGSLTIGVLWLLALTMFLGVKINFANFIAFPITFGVGADYAFNVMSRYQQDGKHDIVGTVRATGSAVALCSLTTVIGYSSLLIAQNRALFLFGVVAVIGEIACLATALTLLPAALVLIDRPRRRPRTRTPPPPDRAPVSSHPQISPGE
jgi:predicted RND superfamily exporter protein